jgi:type III secretory pathway lipoprotein EscJ
VDYFPITIPEAHRSGSRRAVLLSVVLLLIVFSAGCGEKAVATSDNEFEANQMFVILNSNGFRVGKIAPAGESKTWSITIDEGFFGEGESAAAIQLLHDYGLPRAPEPETKDNGSSLGIVSDREEKEKQKRELQRQIERQLYTLTGVIRASVIIALPQDDVLSLEKTPPTASVSLVVKETEPKFSITDVQNLVSGGVPNLKAENVKVAITQQPLSEVPMEKLAAQRRSNIIFVLGTGLIVLLGAILGAVWMIAKRRKRAADAAAAFPDIEPDFASAEAENRPALEGENDE